MIRCIGSTNGNGIFGSSTCKEIKTVPYVPLSHPFVERLIGTIRRECLDRTLFWTTADLEMKLLDFQRYYNGHRAHAGLDGRTPDPSPDPGRRPRDCPLVSMAAALSWAVSDTDGGVTVDDGCGPLPNLAPCRSIDCHCAQCLSEPVPDIGFGSNRRNASSFSGGCSTIGNSPSTRSRDRDTWRPGQIQAPFFLK